MKLAPSSKIFSAIPIRSFLKAISYEPTSVDAHITCGLIFGTDASTLRARRSSHLTNATAQDHQIRYSLKDRVRRALVKLATEVPTTAPFSVQVAADDFLSREFFGAIPQATVETVIGSDSREFLSENDLETLTMLERPHPNLERLFAKCHERIFAGDYRTAYQILSRVPTDLLNDSTHYMLGMCTNFFGETEKSEEYFRHMLRSPNPLSRVKAAYVTSMLYLRMHRKENLSLEMAEELLQTAYGTLSDHTDIEDWTFHRVFNRNGYALCLFRRGKIEEAMAMLEAGILKLREDLSGANRLHQSVLIYNSVQCLRALGRYQECESKCAELLEIDPLFAEYHLELARVYLEQNKTSAALRAIARAEALDGFIPELFALKGFAFLQEEDLVQAAQAYGRAVALKPDDAQFQSDLEYCLEEMGQTA